MTSENFDRFEFRKLASEEITLLNHKRPDPLKIMVLTSDRAPN